MKFSFNVNAMIQCLATALQFANMANDLPLPPKAKGYVTVAIGVIQSISGLLAHFKNPDGSSAKEPWSTGTTPTAQ
jgi:hypothetical protein